MSRRLSSRSSVKRSGGVRFCTRKPGVLGSLGNRERIIGGCQKPARAEDRRIGHCDERRQHAASRLPRPGDHAAISGINQGRRRAVARHQVVRGSIMIRFGRGHAPDQRDLVHDLGQVWKHLADREARHRGGDRLELALDIGRCARLGIERVQMARDHRPARSRCSSWLWASRRPFRPARARSRNQSPRPRPRNPSVPIRRTSRRLGPRHGTRLGVPRISIPFLEKQGGRGPGQSRAPSCVKPSG